MLCRLTGCVLSCALFVMVTGCGPSPMPVPATPSGLHVLAIETFLADIAQNVAGDRTTVPSLLPVGLDPHAFEPSPVDVRAVAASNLLLMNGSGFEAFASRLLAEAGGNRTVIEASQGLASRTAREGETTDAGNVPDPHYWLDPVSVIQYVKNIRDGLSKADPAGTITYASNADKYIIQLTELDRWVREQVRAIPPERRLLVTNHESLGYFADRYGFRIVGTIIPSVSSEASPSAQQLAHLTERVRATGAPAIFLETGANAQLARQLAQETGIQVITELYTHSVTDAQGPAPTYVEMIRHNVQVIVGALKQAVR